MKVLVLISLLMLSFSAFSAESSKKSAKVESQKMVQTKCPFMGTPINKKLYVDHKGKRVYFCCPACIEEFKKDPESVVKKMEAEGVVLEDAAKK